MQINTATHFDMFVLTPAIALGYGECTNPECDSSHVLVQFSWFFWSLEIAF
jgi:hypothetical protein